MFILGIDKYEKGVVGVVTIVVKCIVNLEIDQLGIRSKTRRMFSLPDSNLPSPYVTLWSL